MTTAAEKKAAAAEKAAAEEARKEETAVDIEVEKPENMNTSVTLPRVMIEELDERAAERGISRNLLMQLCIGDSLPRLTPVTPELFFTAD